MKRVIMLILATLAVILSVFSLSSCKKQTRVDLLGYSRDGVEVFHENGNSIVRFYTDTDFGHDVADFEKVKIVFNLTYKNGEVIKRYKEFGYPPENARGNPELQYFDVLIEKEKISDDKPILLVRAKGVFNTEKSDDTENKDGTPSIFMTFVIGLIVLVVAVGVSVFGLQIWDDFQGRCTVIAANVLPAAAHIWAYFWWGTARGIILSFFCAAIIGLTVLASRYIDS